MDRRAAYRQLQGPARQARDEAAAEWMRRRAAELEHDPEKACPALDAGGNRLSGKIMLKAIRSRCDWLNRIII
jgi:hypothetical protein